MAEPPRLHPGGLDLPYLLALLEGIVTGGTTPTGPAGGDLSGTYPDPQVVDDSHAHTASTLSGVVPTTRTITTTAPLTGGGDLSANRVLGIAVFGASGGGHATGAVPDPGVTPGTARYLREDATFAVPPSGGTPPTGTGFRHVTGGAEDAAAQLVFNADVDAAAGIAESKLALNFPTHTAANDPTADQKDALAGTSGTPNAGNPYVTDSDSRLAGGTPPTGTGFRHITGGVEDAAAQLVFNADVNAAAGIVESKLSLNFPTHTSANDPTAGEKAALAGTSGAPGGGNKYVTDADARNTNSRTPTAHAASHQHGGSDQVATATPAANVIPKAGAGGQLAVGFLASGSPDGTKFVRDDGTLQVPAGTGVPTTRTITTTSPVRIDGGGSANLSADRTLSVLDATASVKGVIQLAGDLAGTAAAPEVASAAKSFAFKGTLAVSLTASTPADWAPPGHADAAIFKVTATSGPHLITSLIGGFEGRRISIQNVGSNKFLIANAHGGSGAANRFVLGDAATVGTRAVEVGESAIFEYTDSRWRIVLTLPVFLGNTATTAGTAGVVPAPPHGGFGSGATAWGLRPLAVGGTPGNVGQWGPYSDIFDSAFASTQGSILYRSAAGWVHLVPGTAGHFLKTGGAAANPLWSAIQAASASVAGIMTFAADTEEAALKATQSNDRRLLHDLYKKRQMQLLPGFQTNQAILVIDAVGLLMPTAANSRIGGSGTHQTILGNNFIQGRFLANNSTNSDAWMLETVGICRTDWDTEHVWQMIGGNSTSAIRQWVGLTNGQNLSAVTTPGSGVSVCAFRYDSGADSGNGNWRAVTSNRISGSSTVTDTGVPFATSTAVRMTITTTGTSIKFYLDGVLVATHTTNLPELNDNMGYHIVVRTLDTGNKRIDWARSVHMYI